MKDNNDIDDLFKKSFDNFEVKVKPSVWKNIRAALKWGGLGVLVKLLLNKLGSNTIVAVISSAATVVSTVMVMNWTDTGNSESLPTTNNSVSQKTEVVKKVEAAPLIEAVDVAVDNVEGKVKEPVAPIIVERIVHASSPEVVKESAESAKKKKQKIKSVISSYSGLSIASISASPVGGSVPLIVNLDNTGVGANNKWSYSDGKKGNIGSNPIHVFERPGIYTVTLKSTNDQGIEAIDSISIEVTGNSSISAIPTLFSPNGDGVADVFTFKSNNMTDMKVEIFDKTGKVYYKWSGDDSGSNGEWNGKTEKGRKAKEGTYFYLIEAEGVDGKKYEQKGTINLAR